MSKEGGHEHNPYLCPAHVAGCGCEEQERTACNPYREPGHCPDDLTVMPETQPV